VSAWANAIGLALCAAVGVVLCVLFVRPDGPVFSGVIIGAAVPALYISGWFVGQADARRRPKYRSRNNFDEGMIITLSDGERMRVVEVLPPEGDVDG
jgi:hypothetical protein